MPPMQATTPVPLLDADALRTLASQADPQTDCPACHPLHRPGWESLPGDFDRGLLQAVGTLVDAAVDEPTVAEHHPRGTHAWSADAPIAPAWYPANRCSVWQCRRCHRAYLRYTEYGGYYQDERVRPVDPALVDGSPAPLV